MTRPLICFSHGKDSGPWGTKIAAMAESARRRGFPVESLDYRGLQDPADRVRKLVEYCRTMPHAAALVGSSMGGHVAVAASVKVPTAGLFLIAPAFYMPGYESLTRAPGCARVSIVHGWDDEVVPVENSIRWAREHAAELHLIPGDHRLTARLDRVLSLFGDFLSGLRDA